MPHNVNLATIQPARILVCQQRQIGDALLVTPAVELLKRRFPHAELHLFTERKCEDLLRHNPHIDHFHLLDKKEQASLPSQLRWYHRVARHHFDMVVDFQQLPRCAMLTLFSRAPVRLSYPAPWYRKALYTHSATPRPGYAAATKVSLLEGLGIVWQGEKPRIYLTEAEKQAAAEALEAWGLCPSHSLVTLDPTHRRASKRWPAKYVARLIDIVAEARPDIRFLLLRGPGEDDEVRALRELCTHKNAVILPANAPSLRLSAACMARAALHVGNCSAPRHMAVAVDTPSLTIPGASGPEWTFPDPLLHRELRPALPCQPCARVDCPRPLCLEQVSPQDAAHEALDMLTT